MIDGFDLIKNLYDPSIGKESLTTIDVVGVLIGHIIFGVVATFLLDWSWIPLSTQQKNSEKSLKEIKKTGDVMTMSIHKRKK